MTPSSLPPVAGEPVAVPAPDHDAWNMCSRLNATLSAIGDYAHDRSTGPAVWDPLWEIRRMAYEALEEIPAPLTASKGEGVQSDAGALGENSGSVLSDPSSSSEGATARGVLLLDGMTMTQWLGNELFAFQEATKCDTAAEYLAERGKTQTLWLWKNFINGQPEYWAFDNPYPCESVDGDPLTLGEPCGWARLMPSVNGRPDRSEAEVFASAIRRASSTAAGAKEPNSPIPESAGVREALSDLLDAIHAGRFVMLDEASSGYCASVIEAGEKALATQGATP